MVAEGGDPDASLLNLHRTAPVNQPILNMEESVFHLRRRLHALSTMLDPWLLQSQAHLLTQLSDLDDGILGHKRDIWKLQAARISNAKHFGGTVVDTCKYLSL